MNIAVHYSFRPSRVVLVTEENDQFVLAKTQTRGIVPQYGIAIAMEVLEEIRGLEARINSDRSQYDPLFQYLKLRGVWLEYKRGAVTIYIEHLHDSAEEPLLTAAEIKQKFHDGHAFYQGQSITVNVRVRSANTLSDYFSPISDGYYDWVEREMGGVADPVSSLLASASAEVREQILRALRTESSHLASALPSQIQHQEDIEQVSVVLLEEQNELPLGEYAELTLGSFDSAYAGQEGIRDERLRQAKLTFNAALGLAIFGVVAVLAGAFFFATGKVTSGALTVGAGAVSEAISVLVFRLYKETNNRLDRVGEDLNLLDKSRVAMRIIQQIDDPAQRDRATIEFVNNIGLSLRGDNASERAA